MPCNTTTTIQPTTLFIIMRRNGKIQKGSITETLLKNKNQPRGTPFKALGLALAPLIASTTILASLPRVLGHGPGGKILSDALTKAFRGGIPGFAAALVQIISLMWLRTLMNTQYKTGLSMRAAAIKLWGEGGIPRFYRGIVPALAMVPLARFGDTAANAGVLRLLENSSMIPMPLRTASASAAAALWRVVLMPLDTLKTTMQVEGKQGLSLLSKRVAKDGAFATFFRGTMATLLATWLGHYPWFATRNSLDSMIPIVAATSPLFIRLAREAFIGIIASIVSDFCTNAIRVVKTVRQTSSKNLTYTGAITKVLQEDGVVGLFTRGLGTKTFANVLNSVIFNVMLKLWNK